MGVKRRGVSTYLVAREVVESHAAFVHAAVALMAISVTVSTSVALMIPVHTKIRSLQYRSRRRAWRTTKKCRPEEEGASTIIKIGGVVGARRRVEVDHYSSATLLL